MRRLLSAPPPASRACVSPLRSGRPQKRGRWRPKRLSPRLGIRAALRPTTVRDGVGVEPHLTDLFFGARVVLFVHGVGEQKLLPPLRSVAFQGNRRGRPDKYALFPILGYDY